MFHTQYGTVKVNYKEGHDDQKVYNNWSLQIYDQSKKHESRSCVALQTAIKKNCKVATV